MKNLYVLQFGLNRYFDKISNKNEVIISDKALNAHIFLSRYMALRFKILLKCHYKKDFNIVKF